MGETPRAAPKRVSLFLLPFLLFHVFAITVWSLPRPPKEAREGKTKLRGIDQILMANFYGPLQWSSMRIYAHVTGMWQYWDMFAPNPANADVILRTEVTHRSGKVTSREFLRQADLPILKRYTTERLRKIVERSTSDAMDPSLVALCAYEARRAFTDPNDPPVDVTLVSLTTNVPLPQMTKYGATIERPFFRWAVDPRRLTNPYGER